MKIAQVSDLHINDRLAKHFQINAEKNTEVILKDIEDENVDLVIFTGDYGTIDGMKILKRKLDKLNKSYLFCLGNHDKVTWLIDCKLIKDEKDVEMKMDFDTFSIITINTSNGVLTNDQINRIMNKNENQIKLIFSHYPILNTSKIFFDKELGIKLTNEQNIMFTNNYIRNINIFAGHYHGFEEIELNGIRQIICPGALMQIAESNNRIITESFKFGYNIIAIEENKLSYRPKYFDGFGIDKPW